MIKQAITYDHPKYNEIENKTKRLISNEFNSHNLNVYEKCADDCLFEFIETPIEVKNIPKNADSDPDEYYNNEYPMWNTIFEVSNEFMENDINNNIDEIQELGFGIIHPISDSRGELLNTSLFFKGAGYDFYEAHWIPLFNLLGFFDNILTKGD